MRFEWNERKRQSNLAKHGLDFRDANKVFEAPMLVAQDEREDYGEDRWIGVGLLEGRDEGVVLSHERRQYEQRFRDELGHG